MDSQEIKIAVIGSRNYPNKDEVIRRINKFPSFTTIISGGARGVDKWAEEAALARNLKVEIYVADWDGLGRKAGLIRNTTIINKSDRIVAFWDEKSSGTQDSIRKARAQKKPLCIITNNGKISSLENWPKKKKGN